MAHVNWAGSVFVKTLDFFRIQGGFRDPWGERWAPIVATGIEDAREKFRKQLGAPSAGKQGGTSSRPQGAGSGSVP